MTIPTATWRIQFRNGMTFDRAAGLVPYLKRLGISHLYASPVFTATSGSGHGYDVTDANAIDPAIGGRAGFDRLVRVLKEAGLGLILDIVPNHMAASLENAWWYDVIEHGEKSRYARHFDIDWSRPLTLPFLGDSFEQVLENGDIAVKADPHTGKPALACYESFYPLAPETWQGQEAEVLALTDKAGIAALHQRQPWRLTSWRDAASDLSYRRFFEITGLAGVRVEDRAVFDDTHRLILELVHSGAVDGLRVDHVDGLADPKGYLERLRQEAGPACYITVEKILGEGEQLPADWPVSGTTGYEFISSLSDVLVDNSGIGNLRGDYEQQVGRPVAMESELRAAKVLMADRNFAGEFNRLLHLAQAIATQEGVTQSESPLRAALRELLVAFPVYRTYGTAQGLPEADSALLDRVVEAVRGGVNAPDSQALNFIVGILKGHLSNPALSDAVTFRLRFQQLTGPLMAKSVEDTLFFRHGVNLGLNEVGADPLPRDFSPARFHADMQRRLERQPDAISSTSTHDTKRGEDARARLYALTEAPGLWAGCVARWSQINQHHIITLDDGPAPEPAVRWMLYQALAGAWPVRLRPEDNAGLEALEGRFIAFVEKALREAKLRTDWGNSNAPYEEAVLNYARQLLAPASHAFLHDFTASLQPVIRTGLVNGLTQTTLKLTAPGVPDIYQGSETLDFSLVDPDNRREPDFTALERLGEENLSLTPDRDFDGQLKQQVIARLLHLRQQMPTLFSRGEYLPLSASGNRAEKVIAFARVGHEGTLLVIAPRLVFDAVDGSDPGHPAGWTQTEIILPERLANRCYRNVLSGETISLVDRLTLTALGNLSPLVLLSDELSGVGINV